MELTRRNILVGASTAITVGLAGCGGNGGDGDTPAETTEEQPATTQEPTQTAAENTEVAQRTLVDEELDLAVSSFEDWEVYEDSRMRISYEFEVTSGPAIDVYVFNLDQYRNFENANLFESQVATEGASSGSQSVEVSSGTYRIVADHTDRGETDPTGGVDQQGVTVEFQVSVERL